MTKIQAIERNVRGSLILFLIMLSLFCFPCSGATINSHFHSENIDPNGETTFYSYIKQSDIEESGYTRGLETGSLNYFKGSAKIDDSQTYYDGKIDAKHPPNATKSKGMDYLYNSTVEHKLLVDYNGLKGLSLFYAKGFFRSNRAITASKKLWFLNATSYPTTSINLDATAKMSMSGKYLMDYNIKEADEAYLVFSDAAGFSNKTGSRKIDFLQEGLIKGDIRDVKNYLSVDDEYIARAGIIEDWLPCFCFTGLVPPIEPIEGNDSAWPSEEIKEALRRPVPPPAVKKAACEGDNASCGTEYCMQVGEQAKGEKSKFLDYPDVYVEAFSELKSTTTINGQNWYIYDITVDVRNTGTKDVEFVSLVAEEMPSDPTKVTYVPSSGSIDDVKREPVTVGKSYLWELGSMASIISDPESKRTVSLQINSSEDSASKSMQFYAQYRIGSKKITTDPPVKPIEEETFGEV